MLIFPSVYNGYKKVVITVYRVVCYERYDVERSWTDTIIQYNIAYCELIKSQKQDKDPGKIKWR